MKNDEQKRQLMELMHRIRNFNSDSKESFMTRAEGILLDAIVDGEDEAIKASDLSDRVCMHPTAVSRLMNSLEEKGLIERNLKKDNRRVIEVKATTEGKKVNAKNREAAFRYWEEVFADIPSDDIDNLLRIWRELLDSMERVNLMRRSEAEVSDQV